MAPRRAARRAPRQRQAWFAVLAALALHGAVLALILLLPPRRLPEPAPREGALLIWAEPEASGGVPGAPPSVDGPPGPDKVPSPPAPPEPVPPPDSPQTAKSPPEQALPPPPPAPPPLVAVPLPPASADSAVILPPPEPPPLAAAAPPTLPTPPPPRPEPQRPPARRAAPAAQAPALASPGVGAGDPAAPPAPPPWAAEGATTPPGLLDGHRNVQPVYPPTAQALGQQGTVRLRLRVDVDGRVAMVTLERGSGVAALDAAAIEAARRWRFRPAMRNGQPVSAEALTSVTFQLPGGQPRF